MISQLQLAGSGAAQEQRGHKIWSGRAKIPLTIGQAAGAAGAWHFGLTIAGIVVTRNGAKLCRSEMVGEMLSRDYRPRSFCVGLPGPLGAEGWPSLWPPPNRNRPTTTTSTAPADRTMVLLLFGMGVSPRIRPKGEKA